MTSGIAVTRSPTNLWPLCAREGVHLGTPSKDSGTSISLLIVTERKSRIGGDESASYFILDNAIVDILSLI
jgi:hypothetical protein